MLRVSHNKKTKLALALIALTTLAACSQGAQDQANFTQDRSGNRDPLGTIEVKVKGAYDLSYKGESFLRITESIGRKIPRHQWFLSVGSLLPVFPNPDMGLRFATQLVYQYTGDGTYTIKPNVTSDGQHTLTASDGVVEFTLPKDLTNPQRRFDRVRANCILIIKMQGDEGHLKCPRLANPEGTQQISLDARWTAKPTPTPTPSGVSTQTTS